MRKPNLLYNYVLICLYSFTIFSKSFGQKPNSFDYRLPKTIIPTNYDVSLIIRPEDVDFSGTVNIAFNLFNENDTINDIYLHVDSDFLKINYFSINNDESCTFTISTETQILHATCSSEFFKTDNSIYIEYSGKYSTEDGLGLVKSSYTYQNENYISIGSYFKPIYARRAFPCLDEPDLKTSFSIDVTYPIGYNVISISPIKEELGYRADVTTTVFEPTPKISTYLVSILVSNLQEADITHDSEDEYDFKVFTREELGEYAKTVAGTYYRKIVDTLNDYTGNPYQNLNDAASYHVALPDYLEGMGDFGVFAYRESDILDEGDKTTSRTKQEILINMANKLSHQWYGGHISTSWWSDIWANEAINSYLGYAIADEVEQEFELKNQFVVEIIQKVMQYDAMPFAKALSSDELDVYLPSQIQEQMDISSYYKGANVLNMANYFLIANRVSLKESLQDYYKTLTNLVANGTEILKIFESCNQHTGNMDFDSWIYSPGFPLITVKIEEITDENVEVLVLREKRFVYPANETSIYDDSLWNIPLTLTHQNLVDFSASRIDIIMTPDGDFRYFLGVDWQILNLQVSGLYRVNYDDVLWERLIEALKDDTERKNIHVLNRAQLLDDIFNIARIGDVNYSLAFKLADFLIYEDEYYPWFSALNAFSYLMGKLGDDQSKDDLENYVLSLMENVISGKLTDDDATHIDILKNVLISTWACRLGQSECISYATEKFNDYKENQESLEDYNLREVIFCNGIKYSENVLDDWVFLYDVYTTSTSVHEQDDIINGLGCTDTEIILQTYLEKIISENLEFKKQDVIKVFKSVLSQSTWGVLLVKEFLQNNYNNIVSKYKGLSIWPEMFYAVAEKLVTDDDILWLTAILDDPIFDEYETITNKALTIASVNNMWAQQYQNDVKDILNAMKVHDTH